MTKAAIQGLGPDAQTAVNPLGGKQSDSPARMDLLPATAALAVGSVLKYGAQKYGERNWRRISVKEHLNHLLIHVYAYLAGDTQDDHLEHAATRAMMSLEIHKVGVDPNG